MFNKNPNVLTIQRWVAPGYHSGPRAEPNGHGRGHVPSCTRASAHALPRKSQLVTAGHADTGTRGHRYGRGQRLRGCQGENCCHGLLFASALLVESKPKLVFGELWGRPNQNCHKTLKKEKYFPFYRCCNLSPQYYSVSPIPTGFQHLSLLLSLL